MFIEFLNIVIVTEKEIRIIFKNCIYCINNQEPRTAAAATIPVWKERSSPALPDVVGTLLPESHVAHVTAAVSSKTANSFVATVEPSAS